MLRTDRRAGFTLLEIIVALAALGLLLVMLTEAMRAGSRALDAWHGATRARSVMEPLDVALRRMIERMDPGVFPDPPQILGTANSLFFTTELPNPDTGGRIAADVRLEAVDGSLLLRWTPHGRGVPFGPPPPVRQQVLADRVARLELAYAPRAAGAAWKPAWQPAKGGTDALPGLVRLRIVPAKAAVAWPMIVARPMRERAEE